MEFWDTLRPRALPGWPDGCQGRPLNLILTARNSGGLYTRLVSVATSCAAIRLSCPSWTRPGTAMFTTAVRPPDGPGNTWMGGTTWDRRGKADWAAPRSHPLGPLINSSISVTGGSFAWIGMNTG